MISANVVGADVGDDKTTLLAPLHQAVGLQAVQRFAQRRLAFGCWLLVERSLKASMTRLLPRTKEPSSRSVRRKSYRLAARVAAPWAVTRERCGRWCSGWGCGHADPSTANYF